MGLFDKIKFGDTFVTQNGLKAIFRDKMTYKHYKYFIFIVDKSPEITMLYKDDGTCVTRDEKRYKIVRKIEKNEENDYLMKDVKFGDKFLTRKGEVAIYWNQICYPGEYMCHTLIKADGNCFEVGLYDGESLTDSEDDLIQKIV